MGKTFLSPSWYRVAGERPRLRPHAQIHRQRFRGQTWYVLQDHHTGRFHRIAPAANLMICLMDGRRTMQDIWERVGQRYPDDPPTQDETIQLLAQLHGSDLLQGDSVPDLAEIGHRGATQQRRSMLQRIRNPLALRFPLIDPDRFLTATLPLVRPLFSVVGLLLWLGTVLTGVVLVALHWPELTNGLVDRVLSAENIVLMLAAYPLIKALHELGHGYATKVWGGEVHEMGVMLLVLMPVPYVDASSSSAFQHKWRRAVVGGAGIMTELFLAAVAMIFWVHAEPGLAKAFAFNVMLIGGVSTVLFNGNPLLRFDGYYVLADLVEIPNLGTRANKYIFYLINRYAFGLRDRPSPVTAAGERTWFVGYSICAFLYRVVIVLTIAAFVATKFFVIGILLAIWALSGMFVVPVFKGAKYLFSSPHLRGRRRRAMGVTGAVLAAGAVALFLVPLPYATVMQGVVSVPPGAVVRAETPGVVSEMLATPNTAVTEGQPLFRLDDPALEARVEILQAQLDELRLRLDAARYSDLVEADMLRQQISHTQASLDLAQQRHAGLTVRAPASGRFVVLSGADLPGRFISQGGAIAFVFEDGAPTVRVLISQADVDLVRQRTSRVDVRIAGDLETTRPGTLRQQAPAAVQDVSDLALTTVGGGDVVLDPTDGSGRRMLEPMFQFDIVVDAPDEAALNGAHAWVRFDHDTETVARRTYRALRQLFLSDFDV